MDSDGALMPTDGQSGHPHAVSSAPTLYLHIRVLTNSIVDQIPETTHKTHSRTVCNRTGRARLSLQASASLVTSAYRFGFEGTVRTDLPGQPVVRASAAVEVGLGGVVSNDLVGSDITHEGERVREVSGRTGRKGIIYEKTKKHEYLTDSGSKTDWGGRVVWKWYRPTEVSI